MKTLTTIILLILLISCNSNSEATKVRFQAAYWIEKGLAAYDSLHVKNVMIYDMFDHTYHSINEYDDYKQIHTRLALYCDSAKHYMKKYNLMVKNTKDSSTMFKVNKESLFYFE